MAKNTATVWTVDPAKGLRVGEGFELSAVDSGSTPGITGGSKSVTDEFETVGKRLAKAQEKLFADSTAGGTRSVLLVLQGMDTSGKGGAVKHVMGSLNPQGVSHHAFKRPTDEERAHDFLWRVRKVVPAAGHVGVFDRSHYEDVLATRVRGTIDESTVKERYGLIRDFETELTDAGTRIVKVMLHLGRDEQKARLVARLDRPDKYWKFNPGDVDDRLLWPAYQEAYQLALTNTSTEENPWFVVPADHKWYARFAIGELLLQALEGLELEWPAADFDVEAERQRLLAT